MTIGTDALRDFFNGTPIEISVESATSIGNGNYSGASDVNLFTNSDNAPFMSFALIIDPSAAPTKGDLIELHGRRMDVSSTNDEPQPDSNYEGSRIGLFRADVDAGQQFLTCVAYLDNFYENQIWQFYAKNILTTVSIDANWKLWGETKTKGPTA